MDIHDFWQKRQKKRAQDLIAVKNKVWRSIDDILAKNKDRIDRCWLASETEGTVLYGYF